MRARRRHAGAPVAATSSTAKAPADAAPTVAAATEVVDLDVLVTQTLSGLERSGSGPVLASMLKRTILRKDPTFNEANFGFRGFGELMRNLAERGVVELTEGSAKGDPEVSFPTNADDEGAAFALLRSTVERLSKKGDAPHLSGLKTQMRKEQADFSEKKFGYGGFLQFAKAAHARGFIEMDVDSDADDYVVRVPAGAPASG